MMSPRAGNDGSGALKRQANRSKGAGLGPPSFFCIEKIVLQLLSYVAQTERENLHQRQAKGIAAAKANGIHFGPVPRALPDNFDELRQAWRNKRMTLRAAVEACGIPKSTFHDAALRAEMAVEYVEMK